MSDNTEALERASFEADAEPMGFDLTRQRLAVPEPWAEYLDTDTGHRWGGWLARADAAHRAALAQQAATPAPAEPVRINLESDAVELLKQHLTASDEPPELTLSVGNGHSGFGLYFWESEYPEEGSMLLASLAAPPATPAAQPAAQAGEPLRIVVEHVRPPIPVRDFDWCATFEDYEPGDPQGEGATKQAAIDDLMSKADRPTSECDCPTAAGGGNADDWCLHTGGECKAKLRAASPATPAPAEPVATVYRGAHVTRDGFYIEWHSEPPMGVSKLYAAPPATPAAQPVDLIGAPLNDACWSFVEAMPHQLPGPIWNDLKPAVKAAIERYLAATPAAQPIRDLSHEIEFADGMDDDTPAAQPAEEREAFEAWAVSRESPFRHYTSPTPTNRTGDSYFYGGVQGAWRAWQARAKLDTRGAA